MTTRTSTEFGVSALSAATMLFGSTASAALPPVPEWDLPRFDRVFSSSVGPSTFAATPTVDPGLGRFLESYVNGLWRKASAWTEFSLAQTANPHDDESFATDLEWDTPPALVGVWKKVQATHIAHPLPRTIASESETWSDEP